MATKPTTCDIMMFHQLVGRPGEDITRRTTQVAGLRLTGKWNAFEKCSEARVMRHAAPKSTETRVVKRAGRVCRIIPRGELGGEPVRDVVRG